jgi:hypothetical protein
MVHRGPEVEAFEQGGGGGRRARAVAVATAPRPWSWQIASASAPVTKSDFPLSAALPRSPDRGGATQCSPISTLAPERGPGRGGPRDQPADQALLPVHLYGHPADDYPISRSREHRLAVVNACQAVGAR